MRRRALRNRFRKQTAQERAIHLHHVWQIELEHVCDGLLHRGMIAADVENAVAAQEIEVIPIIHVIQISAFRPRIDAIKTDDALGRYERAIKMPLVQVVVLAKSSVDDLFQIKSHADGVGDLPRQSNSGRVRKEAAELTRSPAAFPFPNLTFSPDRPRPSSRSCCPAYHNRHAPGCPA